MHHLMDNNAQVKKQPTLMNLPGLGNTQILLRRTLDRAATADIVIATYAIATLVPMAAAHPANLLIQEETNAGATSLPHNPCGHVD